MRANSVSRLEHEGTAIVNSQRFYVVDCTFFFQKAQNLCFLYRRRRDPIRKLIS